MVNTKQEIEARVRQKKQRARKRFRQIIAAIASSGGGSGEEGGPPGDIVAPILTGASATITGPTTVDVRTTTNENNGVLHAVATTSATAPIPDQVKLGQNHLGATVPAGNAGTRTLLSTGLKVIGLVGFTPATYYGYLMHEDLAGNQSLVVSTPAFTIAGDVTAPVLTLPSFSSVGSTTATLSVTTDEPGALSLSVTTSITPPPSQNIIDGVGATYANTQSVPSAGVKSFSVTGLANSTGYYGHFVQEDAALNRSTVVSTALFTTASAGAPVVANQAIDFGRLTQIGAGGATLVATGGSITSVTLGTRTVGSAHWNTTAYPIIPTTIPADVQYVWTGCTATGPGGTSAPFTLTINTAANTYSVANATEFQTILALTDAVLSGKTIKLRPNTTAYTTGNRFGRYGSLSGTCTIESHDHNIKAMISTWTFDAPSGPVGNFDFRYIDFYRVHSTMSAPYSLLVFGQTIVNVGLYNCSFHMDYMKAREGQVQSPNALTAIFSGTGCYATNLTIQDCIFYETLHCISCGGTGITIKRNEFYHFWGDAVIIASSAVSDTDTFSARHILIEDNYVHDPVGSGGYHQDFVQAYSLGGSTFRDINGVTVRGNVMLWGIEGKLAPDRITGVPTVGMQGIQNADNVPKNHNYWLIEGNVFESAMGNAINFEMSGNRGNIIRNNTIVPPYISGAFAGKTSGAPLIRLNGGPTNLIYNNTSTDRYLIPEAGVGGAIWSNNREFGLDAPLSTQTAVFQGTTFEPTNRTELLNNLRMKVGGALDADASGTFTVDDIGAVGTSVTNGYWDFTNKLLNAGMTGTGAPTVTLLNPLDNATNVNASTNLVITFNESVAPGAGNLTIHKASDNSVIETFTMPAAATAGTVTFNANGTVVTINPATFLADSYYVKIDAGWVTDLWGNAYAGIATTTAWNFTTSGDVTTVATKLSASLSSTTLPVILPTGVFAGDIIFGIYHCTLGTGPATPAGLTLETSQENAAGSNNRFGGLYWKIANSADAAASLAGTAAFTFTHGTAVTQQAIVIYVARNAVDLEATSFDNADVGGHPNSPSLTPSWGSAANRWYSLWSYGRTSLFGPSVYPTGYDDDRSYLTALDPTSGDLDIGFGGASKLATSTVDDPSGWTMSTGTVGYNAFTVAIKPGVGGGDVTAPVLTLPTGVATGTTTANIGATTDTAEGTMYGVTTNSATPPTGVQVEAGQDHTSTTKPSNNQAISSTGAKTIAITGMISSTTYFPYVMHKDVAGNRSNVAAGASFATSGGAVTADIVAMTKMSTGVTPATNMTISIPAGTTLNKRMLLLWVGTSTAATLPTTPSGWNILANTDQSSPSRRTIVFERLGVSSMSSFDIVHAEAINQAAICVLLNNGGVPEAVSTDNVDASWNPDPLAITPSGGSLTYLMIAAFAQSRDPTRTVSLYPANCPDDRDNVASNGVGTKVGVGIASATVTASTFNPDLFTLSGTVGSTAWTIAIPPA